MTDISRYSPDDASTYNAALQSLEDLYLRIGNAFEPITSGTLTTATQLIDLSVSSTDWRCVRLMTNLQHATGVNTSYDLYANHDRSASYGYTILGVTTVVGAGATLSTTRIPQFISSSGALTSGDVWIYFNSPGFLLVSSISYQVTDIFLARYGGYGNVGQVSSIQIDMGAGETFAAGGTYILEGIRL